MKTNKVHLLKKGYTIYWDEKIGPKHNILRGAEWGQECGGLFQKKSGLGKCNLYIIYVYANISIIKGLHYNSSRDNADPKVNPP